MEREFIRRVRAADRDCDSWDTLGEEVAEAIGDLDNALATQQQPQDTRGGGEDV